MLGTTLMHTEGIEPLVDPLISVPRLCSNECTVIFDKLCVKILDSNMRLVSTGDREPGENGLYKLPLESRHVALHVTEETNPDSWEDPDEHML